MRWPEGPAHTWKERLGRPRQAVPAGKLAFTGKEAGQPPVGLIFFRYDHRRAEQAMSHTVSLAGPRHPMILASATCE